MKKGFTLIELLIVIAIIAILAVVVFVALDPLSRFQSARDAQRWSDVTAVLDAAKLNQVDNGGSYLAAISGLTAGSYYTIGTCASGGDSGCTAKTTLAACADLTGLATAGQIATIPTDPSTGTAAKTDYYILRASTGVLTIGACDPEKATAISVSR
ncbi:MAG: prepilin-type N-terminal cleavage/methylation domain-containing protein [Parcubacteria group bacterium]